MALLAQMHVALDAFKLSHAAILNGKSIASVLVESGALLTLHGALLAVYYVVGRLDHFEGVSTEFAVLNAQGVVFSEELSQLEEATTA